MSKESKARYEHYRKNLYEQKMKVVRADRARRYKNRTLLQTPSIMGAVWTAENNAKKEAKAMVKEDKRLAKKNKMQLEDFPRTEWAEDPTDPRSEWFIEQQAVSMNHDILTRIHNHLHKEPEKTSEFLLGLAADEIERLREQNEYMKSVVESLLVEARQAKHGIEDMYE